ncbi:MAG: DUF4136 domain-containing protein [Burkholderiaceae bacterium]|jgi:hypothetical protein|nr:DUF4136 domain-containing protein [Burkholderiaceae bacterium]
MRLSMVPLAAALLATGCATGPDVRTDFDPAADFARFRTYGFVAHAGTDQGDVRSITTLRLQQAASREMEARGYVRADEPDLLINFTGRLQERVDIESWPAPAFGAGWGYRAWPGSAWGGWGGTQVTTRRYTVGTLVIDLVDREKRQAVFQGSAEGVVTQQMQNNPAQAIDDAVAHIFARFPFVAGRAEPVAVPR